METLPEEIRLLIFSYLDEQTLKKKCATVNKTWLRWIRNEPTITSDHISVQYELKTQEINDLISNWQHLRVIEIPQNTRLDKIDFSPCTWLDCIVLYDNGFGGFGSKELNYPENIPKCLEIKKVCLDTRNIHEKWTISNVMHLKVNGHNFKSPVSYNKVTKANKVIKDMANLQILEIEMCIKKVSDMIPFFYCFPNLDNIWYLNIRSMKSFLSILPAFQRRLKNITHLEIRDNLYANSEDFARLLNFKNLQKIIARNLTLCEEDIPGGVRFARIETVAAKSNIPLSIFYEDQGNSEMLKKARNLISQLKILVCPAKLNSIKPILSSDNLSVNLDCVTGFDKTCKIIRGMTNLKTVLIKLSTKFEDIHPTLPKDIENELSLKPSIKVLVIHISYGKCFNDFTKLCCQLENSCPNVHTIRFEGRKFFDFKYRVEKLQILDDSLCPMASFGKIKTLIIDTCIIAVTRGNFSYDTNIEELVLKSAHFENEDDPAKFLSRFSTLKRLYFHISVFKCDWRKVFDVLSSFDELTYVEISIFHTMFNDREDHYLIENAELWIKRKLRSDIEVKIYDDLDRRNVIFRGVGLKVARIDHQRDRIDKEIGYWCY